jgi:hypothetical protein
MPHRVKPKIIAHRLRHIALNRALSRKFENFCKFLSPAKVKTRKNKSRKKRPVCNRHAVIQEINRRREHTGQITRCKNRKKQSNRICHHIKTKILLRRGIFSESAGPA